MSVPFSNTHLRVPRGFGTILEGLAREVLRDQPEDIPKYAAQYFDALLKKRKDSGMDPAEWAAKLEDRFYNNHAFKMTPEQETATEVTISKEISHESPTEDESSHSAEASKMSSTHTDVSEKVDSTESAEEAGKEKHVSSTVEGLSGEEPVNRLPVADVHADELSGTEEEQGPTITAFEQVDRAEHDQEIPQFEVKPTDLLSFGAISNVDVCAQELGMAEDEGGETTVLDQEIVDSDGEGKPEVEEPEEVFPYSGLADVDVCATELVETESTMKRATEEDDTHVIEEESSKAVPETTVLPSSSSQSEDIEQVAEDQEEETKEGEGKETETSSGGRQESLTHIEGGLDSNVIPKEDSLVEISFEDVPEAPKIKEVGEREPEEEDSVEVLQTKTLEMHQGEESKEVTAVATNENISTDQDKNEREMVGVEEEVNSECEEMESKQEVFDTMNEKVDTNYSNLNDSEDDEKGDGVKTVSLLHQPYSEPDKDNPDESDCKNEDNKKISEGNLQQNDSSDPDFKKEETTDTVGGEKEDTHTEGYSEVEEQEINDGGEENYSSILTHLKTSTAAMEAEGETLEESARHLHEESQRTGVKSQPEDTVVEKEVTSKEGTSERLVQEGKVDSEIQGKSDAMCDTGSTSPTQSANVQLATDHQVDEVPLGSERDNTDLEDDSGDKQEDCSRPQEEEDIMDIPLDDPEANRAAAKIQAGFRGHMTRKKMKPEDKAEGEEVSSTGDVLNGSQGDTETGGSGAVERDDTSVPEQ